MNKHILSRRQLMFDEFTNEIVEEPIKYWKTMDEVPEHIKKFILDSLSTRVIYDSNTNQYHCSKCLKVLDENYYCSNCSKQCRIPISKESKYVINTNIKEIKNYEEDAKHYVFDIVDGEVLIYIFNANTRYFNNMMYIPYQINKISIEEVYQVSKDGLRSLLNDKFLSFYEYNKANNFEDSYELAYTFEFLIDKCYLYTDNLYMLEDTLLYKYTGIWKIKNYFETDNFNLSSLTYYPLYFKEFEYLIKMKLYRLAATGTSLIKYQHNFKDTFGVDKKYYSFMKDIDIDDIELRALKLCPTTDIDLINFIAKYIYLFEELSKYVSCKKVKLYLESQKLNYYHIHEYYDYIKCCEQLSLNLKDKQILFPKDFIKSHDKITSEMVIVTDPKTNERIQTLSNILALNRYEDDKYIIFPASSVDSLIDESTQQSNCVRTYCMDVSNNECQIYFMRNKNNVDKSLVTIEVIDGKIVQARTRFNELPTDEMNEVLKKWEKQIIPVKNDFRLNETKEKIEYN